MNIDDPLASNQMSDHDNIITLISEVRRVREDIKELKDGTSYKLDDLAKRVEFLEKYKGTIATTFTLYGVAIGALFTIICYMIFTKPI